MRTSRVMDKQFFTVRKDYSYEKIQSDLSHQEFYFEMEDGVKLHGALFKPDSLEAIATIFHHPGNGMNINRAAVQYSFLIERGYQVFTYERRGFANSTGVADNALELKDDALNVFDQLIKEETVKGKPVILWGQSLGGAFATMNMAERHDFADGLIVEGTFNSFNAIGQHYAGMVNMEKIKWMIPLLSPNDYPAEENIQKIHKPVVVIHSKEDKQVPYELGRALYQASNKESTQFWEIDGLHINGMNQRRQKYLALFDEMLQPHS
ncbi:alpha/beta hydrolase [Sediminitomix flava]|nr:alpha/beta hydrolase [Sediminitomix flava]